MIWALSICSRFWFCRTIKILLFLCFTLNHLSYWIDSCHFELLEFYLYPKWYLFSQLERCELLHSSTLKRILLSNPREWDSDLYTLSLFSLTIFWIFWKYYFCVASVSETCKTQYIYISQLLDISCLKIHSKTHP